MPVLPICPRPYDQEAARSWLARVGDIYGLNAERLVGVLGVVPFQAGSGSRLTRPVEAALDAHGLDTLAVAAQLPSTRLAEMRPGPIAWTLTHQTECSVCAQCLDEDLRQKRRPYLRALWRQAWRIFCPTHGVRLVRSPMSVFKKPLIESRLTEAVDGLLTHSAAIENLLLALHRQDAQFVELTRIMRAMETVIDDAIAGRTPNANDWGRLTSFEFLQIVYDVTTWSLTNFEAFKARPPSEEVPTETSLWETTPYYKLSYRYQPPFDSEQPLRTLASVNVPELRCPALWWAHALLSAAHPVKDPRHCSPKARLRAYLRRRCPNGLHWLLQQTAHWPEAYIRERWLPIEQLL